MLGSERVMLEERDAGGWWRKRSQLRGSILAEMVMRSSTFSELTNAIRVCVWPTTPVQMGAVEWCAGAVLMILYMF